MSAHPIVASVLGGAVIYKWVKENCGVLGPLYVSLRGKVHGQQLTKDTMCRVSGEDGMAVVLFPLERTPLSRESS